MFISTSVLHRNLRCPPGFPGGFFVLSVLPVSSSMISISSLLIWPNDEFADYETWKRKNPRDPEVFRAVPPRFELRLTEPKSAVLPLHHGTIFKWAKINNKMFFHKALYSIQARNTIYLKNRIYIMILKVLRLLNQWYQTMICHDKFLVECRY